MKNRKILIIEVLIAFLLVSVFSLGFMSMIANGMNIDSEIIESLKDTEKEQYSWFSDYEEFKKYSNPYDYIKKRMAEEEAKGWVYCIKAEDRPVELWLSGWDGRFSWPGDSFLGDLLATVDWDNGKFCDWDGPLEEINDDNENIVWYIGVEALLLARAEKMNQK